MTEKKYRADSVEFRNVFISGMSKEEKHTKVERVHFEEPREPRVIFLGNKARAMNEKKFFDLTKEL